jgi:hypothetical protein
LRLVAKNTLRGFADLELPDLGIVIHDCPWHCKNASEWVSFPARAYTDNTGAKQWAPILEFTDAKALRTSFQRAALEAIHGFEGEFADDREAIG